MQAKTAQFCHPWTKLLGWPWTLLVRHPLHLSLDSWAPVYSHYFALGTLAGHSVLKYPHKYQMNQNNCFVQPIGCFTGAHHSFSGSPGPLSLDLSDFCCCSASLQHRCKISNFSLLTNTLSILISGVTGEAMSKDLINEPRHNFSNKHQGKKLRHKYRTWMPAPALFNSFSTKQFLRYPPGLFLHVRSKMQCQYPSSISAS